MVGTRPFSGLISILISYGRLELFDVVLCADDKQQTEKLFP